MGRKWVLLLACAAALADDDEAGIRAIFAVPGALPGKLDFAEYKRVLKAAGYPAERTSEAQFRPYVASYLAELLQAACTVRKIVLAKDGKRAQAIIDHQGDLYRWFLVKRDGRWRYGDFEHEATGLRFSDGQHRPQALDDAYDAWYADDNAQALRILRANPGGKMAPSLQAARLLLVATILWEDDENEAALAELKKIEALGVDPPKRHLLRAQAAFDAGQYAAALKAARAYLAAVGENASGRYQAGRAYREMDWKDKAAAEHVAGLAADPTDGDNVLGLVRALPPGRKREAVPHFLKLQPLEEWLDWICYYLEDEDWDGVDALVDAFRARFPKSLVGEKWLLKLMVERDQWTEAAPRIFAYLPHVEGDEREDWAEWYLHAMEETGRPIEGYEMLSEADRDVAWDHLAYILAWEENAADLERLLELRRKRTGSNAEIGIWEVEVLWLAGKHAEVVARVAKDAALFEAAESDESERPLDRQVRSLVKLGRTAEAVERAVAWGDPFFRFLAHAAAGEPEKARAAFLEEAEDGYWQQFYDDAETASLLRDKAYDKLRAQFPPEDE